METDQYPLNSEIRLHNVMGQLLVYRETITALLAAHPNGREVIALALQNAERLVDLTLASPLPEAVIAAAQLELENLRRLDRQLAARDAEAPR
jgi:hypothetical protein